MWRCLILSRFIRTFSTRLGGTVAMTLCGGIGIQRLVGLESGTISNLGHQLFTQKFRYFDSADPADNVLPRTRIDARIV